MNRRTRTQRWAILPAVLLAAAACGGGTASPTPRATATATAGATGTPAVSPSGTSTVSPTDAPGASETPKPLLLPEIDLSTIGGDGEGELNLIIWAGYAEDGTNVAEYDWVNPFEERTGCQVSTKPDDTSDQMVTDMRSSGGTLYDGVSASGDATLRLIANGDVAAVDVTQIPDFPSVQPFMADAPHYVVDGKHYGVPHGWGGNLMMYDTSVVTTDPTSWSAVFEPDPTSAWFQAMTDDQLVTDYDSPIYIADAALYLKSARPELGITDPYELTSDQFEAAVQLLLDQHDLVGKYWSLYGDEIDNFKSGVSAIGTSWPYQLNVLQGEGEPVEAIVPTEGMTGWADTWMISSNAQHPNCMLKWMAWMLTPEVQAQVAENFGEAPANPEACQFLDPVYGPYGFADFCTLFSVNDEAFYSSIAFWKTPLAECGDDRGATCIDYSEWTTRWTEIRG